MNNLKQLTLALHNYHSSHRCFPPAAIWAPPGEPLGGGEFPIGVMDRIALGVASASEPDRMYANWAVMLLPFIDQGPLYGNFNMNAPIGDPANARARATHLEVMTCPSDSFHSPEARYERALLAGTAGNSYARGNYAMNFGTSRSFPNGVLNPDTGEICRDGFDVQGTDFLHDNWWLLGSGVGGFNASLGAQDFSQAGLSNMVALDEIRAGVHLLDVRGSWALGFIGASVAAHHGIYGDDGGPNNGSLSADDIVGCSALKAAFGAEALVQQCMPCHSDPNPAEEVNGQATARSMHLGGVHVGLLDGSVHFVTNAVDQRVWHDMHSRKNRETASISFSD
jgi:hypothetical protein